MGKIYCSDVISKATWIILKQGVVLSQKVQILEVTRLILHYTAHIFMLSILIFNIINGIESENITLVNRMVCLLIPVLNLIAKVLTLQKNRESFLALLEDLQSDAFNEHSDRSNEHIHFVDKIRKLMMKYFMITIGVFLLVGSVFPVIISIDLLIPNPFRNKRYDTVYKILHFISTTYFGFNSGCFDVLYVSLIAMCIAQLRILGEMLLNIAETSQKYKSEKREPEFKDVREALKKCIILHVTITEFVKKINTVLSFPLFIQYTCGCFVICNAILQLTIMGKPDTANVISILAYVSITFSQMAIYHWLGNEIIYKSNKIIEVCYLSNWYKLDIKSRRILLLLMERAKRPLIIQLYQLVYISVESLAVIVRWSYSFFALIKAGYSRNY